MLAVDAAPWKRIEVLDGAAVGNDGMAVDENVFHAHARLMRLPQCGFVMHLIRIEHNEVCKGLLAYLSSIGEAKTLGGKTGQFVDCVL